MRKIIFFVLMGILACHQPKENVTEQNNEEPVLTSLLNVQFFEPEWTPAQKAKLDSNLQVALKNFEADPSEGNYIWYGRREGYLYHFNKAIEIFSEGIEKFPESFRLYRHRGHRYISTRQFDKAIADFEKAAQLMEGEPVEVEPDGQPNKLNKPLSSTQFNVWYHLGLVHYLKRDFAKAEEAYLKCLLVSDNDDLKTATMDWLYMTYRREGKLQEANDVLQQITDSMTIIENDSYFKRLKMYKGELKPEEVLNPDPNSEDYDLSLATQGYGVGNWYLYNSDTAKAKEIFKKVVSGKHFSAFGFIAAEAELAR